MSEKKAQDNKRDKGGKLIHVTEEQIQAGKADMTVLRSPDKWFGVTYAADKAMVQEAIRNMTTAGDYPDGLWK